MATQERTIGPRGAQNGNPGEDIRRTKRCTEWQPRRGQQKDQEVHRMTTQERTIERPRGAQNGNPGEDNRTKRCTEWQPRRRQ